MAPRPVRRLRVFDETLILGTLNLPRSGDLLGVFARNQPAPAFGVLPKFPTLSLQVLLLAGYAKVHAAAVGHGSPVNRSAVTKPGTSGDVPGLGQSVNQRRQVRQTSTSLGPRRIR